VPYAVLSCYALPKKTLEINKMAAGKILELEWPGCL
jgi:hypothetical protein